MTTKHPVPIITMRGLFNGRDSGGRFVKGDPGKPAGARGPWSRAPFCSRRLERRPA
jgi:hypothetical protein